MDIPSSMCSLDLYTMHAPKFPEYANIGVADIEDGEFIIEMKYGSRKSVIAAIRSYTIFRGVDYVVYEFESQTFYAKCKNDGNGYNGRHTCSIGMILQDHSKLDSNTIAEAMKPLVESNPSIKNTEAHQRKRARFTYSEFTTQQIETNMQRARNIVVHRFDRRNEVFKVEQLPYRHVIACCANQYLDWQMYVGDIYKMSKIHKVYRIEFILLGYTEI
ncbi:hypothetical protein Ahy_A05g022352 [Arachis hypogaea]|uniref:Transposase MuDR plant domain-containing protein n=1 Tax=Arachis hypogaea TaxID=3818 RepID=A0A445D0D6_ARAHY|nr:hypothetical protein Ahy_A05g022352 [Arachis hypogaea]